MTAHPRNFSTPIDPAKLDRLAEVAVKVGLRLQAGQDLLLTAPTVALPLVRMIAEHAYKAGAGLVTPILSDEAITLSRYRFGHDPSFDRAAGWLYEGMSKAFAANTARLAIVGDDPMLLSGQDPGKVGARQQGQLHCLQAGAGTDRDVRYQLEHHRLSEPFHGRNWCSPMMRRMSRSASWPMPSLPPRASTVTARSARGKSTTPRCATAPAG